MFFLKERLALNLMSGIVLAVLGSGLIDYGDTAISKEALMRDGLALLRALTASGYFLVGHTTFNRALRYLPASMVTITIVGEPVGSTILAYFLGGEGFTTWKVTGGILILSGILIAIKRKR